jgi:hypothetical protein
MRRGTRLVVVVLAALAAAWYSRHPHFGAAVADAPDTAVADAAPADSTGFTREASGTMMRVGGRVQRLLADDREGSAHQRFIIATSSGVTLLVAHNIDLAPRLDGLAAGDPVEVYGEYEWNDQGGLIHWTHKDPGGNHSPGYVDWRGRRYQ